MPLILEPPSPQDDAVQTRILAAQAVAIVQQYGPRAVLQATADALTYYALQVKPGEPGSSVGAYNVIAGTVAECRRAIDALDRESREFLTQF